MKLNNVPRQKVGTPFQRPSWRYDAVKNPDRYGFRSLCSRQKATAGCYKRLLGRGLSHTVTYDIPPLFQSLMEELPKELSNQLYKVWHKQYYKENRGKIRFHGVNSLKEFESWNLKKAEKLTDQWLQKAIRHVYSFEHNEDIAFAIKLYLNKELSETSRFIGYEIFAGTPDAEIAKSFQISQKRIEAFRMLFFDFSHFPKNKVARWSLLRQLKENNEVKEEEFALFKRVFDMGALGIKAQVCHNHLSDDERNQVSDYLAKSAMENTFNLNFSIRTTKDALMYNKVISDLAKLQLQKEEIKLRNAELRLMELQIIKTKKEVNVETDTTQPEDLRLLQEHINQISFKDGDPQFGSVIDLHDLK